MLKYTFTNVLFLSLSLFVLLLLSPFFSLFLFSFCFVSLVYPVYNFFQRKIGKHNYLHSALTVFLALLFCIAPFVVLMSFGISHLLEVLKNILSELEKDEVSQSFSVLIGAIQYYAYDFFSVSLEKLEIKNYILTHLKNFVDVLYRYSPMVIITSFKAVVQFFLFLLTSIVLLAEVKNIMSYVENLFKKNKNKLSLLLVDVRESIKSTFYSGILVGVAQATLIVLGIIFYSFSQLILLIPLIYLFCLVPVVGAFVCYTSASIYLVLTGDVKAGLIFMVYGVLVVSTVDNILRSFVIKGKNKAHPFLLFLVLIGGAKIFGVIGILLAPIILFLFLSMQKMYFKEKKSS